MVRLGGGVSGENLPRGACLATAALICMSMIGCSSSGSSDGSSFDSDAQVLMQTLASSDPEAWKSGIAPETQVAAGVEGDSLHPRTVVFDLGSKVEIGGGFFVVTGTADGDRYVFVLRYEGSRLVLVATSSGSDPVTGVPSPTDAVAAPTTPTAPEPTLAAPTELGLSVGGCSDESNPPVCEVILVWRDNSDGETGYRAEIQSDYLGTTFAVDGPAAAGSGQMAVGEPQTAAIGHRFCIVLFATSGVDDESDGSTPLCATIDADHNVVMG